MNAHGIDIFHITNGNGGIICITHYLVFDLFVALYAFFDKNLVYR